MARRKVIGRICGRVVGRVARSFGGGPAVPGIATVDASSTTDAITFTATDVAGATEITVELYSDSDLEDLAGTCTLDGGNGFTDSIGSLDPDTTYYARWFGTNAAGDGPYSATTPVTTLERIALLASASSSGLDGGTTPGIDTTGASFLIVAVATWDLDVDLANLSDSEGNTWTPLTQYQRSPTEDQLRMFYTWNPNTSASHTFSYIEAGSQTAIAAMSFRGVRFSSDPFDIGSGGNNSAEPGPLTPSEGDCLIVVSAAMRTDPATISDPSFSIEQQIITEPGVHLGVAIAYYVQGSSASLVDPVWSTPGFASAIASFKHE